MTLCGLVVKWTPAATIAMPAAACAQAITTASPHLGGGGALEISLGRIVASLTICVIVAVLAILLIRQRGGKADLSALFARFEARPRAVEIVETRRLSPHADLCVVRHDGREYLLVLQHGSTHVLRDREMAEAPGLDAA